MARRYIGHGDSEFTETGLRQVEAVGRRFQGISFSAIYASDLGRALRTAEAIGRHHACTPVVDARLRERHYGVMEGLGFDEARDRYPAAFEHLDGFSSEFVIPEGESARQVRDRLASFLAGIDKIHRGQTIVAVSHGGMVRTLLWHLLDLPFRSVRWARCDNTSISSFLFSGGVWNLELWNDTAHLSLRLCS